MNTPVTVAHWNELPLGPGGRALVEASAGTGKTWTIGVLWWRLLLEPAQAPGVERIVVTTFTEAAAQELRERLRARLRQALDLADTRPAITADTPGDTAWLLTRWQEENVFIEDRRRLRLALADFDRAPIGTLHGLCRGILAEHPLEGGQGIEVAEAASGQALLEELAHDAWRVLRQSDTDGLAEAGVGELSLAKFTRTLATLLRPGVRLPSGETFDEARAELAPSLATPLRDIADEVSWFTRKNAKLLSCLSEMADWLAGADWPKADERLGVLAEFQLDGQVRPERQSDFMMQPAISRLLDEVPRLVMARHGHVARFWSEQVARVSAWRDQRLAARGQLTFDEMIRQAHTAVSTRPALADALFEDWPYALVDEFQDTDDQQYGILDRIYRDAEGQPRGRLVMIGDPKQAIYGFRGGDVQAYLRARAHAGHRLALDTNHRSAPNYVAAVNGFFADDAAGPALDARGEGAIRYEPVLASDRQVATPYRIGGEPVQAPLVLHYLGQPPASQPERKQAAIEACADHIAALLADPSHTIARKHGDTVVHERLRPGDLAVLLPTNPDIARLREALGRRGVPCVGGSRASVFDSDWAFELQVVLQALAHGEDEGAVRAAMLTRLWGGSLHDVAALGDSPAAWEATSDRLQQLRLAWRDRGVLATVLELAASAAPRLLAHASGERDLTDLRHLGELLQQQADQGLGPHALLDWLGEQRQHEDSEAPDGDQRQLRIESDAARVQLMTLHRAKGLEFPVVFLPLLWAHALNENQDTPPWLLPEPDAPGRLARFDAPARRQARHEAQDERFRVLYVALTRAIHACHVYALPPSRPATAKKNASPKSDPERAPLDALLERLGVEVDFPVIPHLHWQAGWPAPAPALVREEAPPAPREALPMPPPARLRQRLSFSTLVGGARVGGEEDSAASDEREPALAVAAATPEEPPHPALVGLSALRGRAFGNAVHASFENRDTSKSMATQTGLVAKQLADFGVRARGEALDDLLPRLCERLDGSLAAQLLPGLRLGAVAAADQRAEMSFHFALDGARLESLRQACIAHGEPDLVPALGWRELRGLMTGKIDLVFEHRGRVHVLDYKGNWLGERLGDYTGVALAQAMDHSHYRLQALIYTVAVHRFLKQRRADYDPGQHLGEAIYLFIRAAGLAPGAGVWSHAFPPALLEAVDQALAAGATAEAAA